MHPLRVRRGGLLPALTTLAIHPGALGDLILFARLLSRFPAPVTLVSSAEVGSLLVDLGVVSSSLDFHALPFHDLFSDTPASACSLARLLPQADRLISCFPGPGNSAACTRLAALCGADSSAFLPVRPPAEFTAHLVDFWSDLMGIPSPSHSSSLVSSSSPSSSPRPRVSASPRLSPARSALESLSLSPSVPFLLIHPGAGSAAKCWPLDRFLALARSAGPALFILGPVELDRWPASTIDSIRREFPTLLSPPLATLAGLSFLARACIGNDSGFCHLAAALGAPTLALFGATRPVHFAPLGPRARLLSAGSMDAISLDQVHSALA